MSRPAKRQKISRRLLLLVPLAACSTPDPEADNKAATSAAAQHSAGTTQALRPPTKRAPSNPLGLPPRKLAVEGGQLVFAVPERMLEGAREGSSLALTVAKVNGLEGDDLLVEGSTGAIYRVHPGYVVPVPVKRTLRPRQAVVAEYAGALRHGYVIRQEKDRWRVRFLDVGERAPELLLKSTSAFFVQTEGLQPGNYAALRSAEGPLHVLLVAPVVRGDRRHWLTLGFAGVTRVVEESLLVPIPLGWNPKAGEAVLAETLGKLRKASIEGKGESGVFWVRFERAGRAEMSGLGSILGVSALPQLEAPPPAPPGDEPKAPEPDGSKAKTYL